MTDDKLIISYDILVRFKLLPSLFEDAKIFPDQISLPCCYIIFQSFNVWR